MGPWLYIVLLGACIMLFAWLKPNNAAARPSAGIEEIEETLEQFALELEEDNRQLMEATAGIRSKLEADILKLSGRVDALEKQLLAYAQASPAQPAAQPEAAVSSEQQEEQAESAPADMKSRYPELFAYYAQGKSMEYIAKKTGMNKGEVELIIQLAKQEEQFRVQR